MRIIYLILQATLFMAFAVVVGWALLYTVGTIDIWLIREKGFSPDSALFYSIAIAAAGFAGGSGFLAYGISLWRKDVVSKQNG